MCCYDKDGNLIDSRVKKGGTLQRYHYLGGVGNVPYVTNFYYDVLPSLHCCRYFDTRLNGFSGIPVFSECQDYLEFRDVSSCVNYIPPQPGISYISCIFVWVGGCLRACISIIIQTIIRRVAFGFLSSCLLFM